MLSWTATAFVQMSFAVSLLRNHISWAPPFLSIGPTTPPWLLINAASKTQMERSQSWSRCKINLKTGIQNSTVIAKEGHQKCLGGTLVDVGAKLMLCQRKKEKRKKECIVVLLGSLSSWTELIVSIQGPQIAFLFEGKRIFHVQQHFPLENEIDWERQWPSAVSC